jgi:hypothetical protein
VDYRYQRQRQVIAEEDELARRRDADKRAAALADEREKARIRAEAGACSP